MKAIRINGLEVLTGVRHLDALLEYQQRENLTDDQLDAMLDAGQIEFGQIYLKGKEMTKIFGNIERKTELYKNKKIVWDVTNF